jgi:hypothetical protein
MRRLDSACPCEFETYGCLEWSLASEPVRNAADLRNAELKCYHPRVNGRFGLFRVVCIIASIALIAAGRPFNARTEPKPVNVVVSVFTSNCGQLSTTVRYEITSDDLRTIITRTVVPTRVFAGVYQFATAAAPGHYELDVNADGKELLCQTTQMFTVIPGHDRHLVAVLGINQQLHLNCSLAGTLPVKGLSVDLIIPKGAPMPIPTVGGCCMPAPEVQDFRAEVDGDAYYVEHIWAWKYQLVVGGGSTQGEIPIDLSRAWDPKSPFCSGSFIHNVTPQELKGIFPPISTVE